MVRRWKPKEEAIKKLTKWLGREEKNQEREVKQRKKVLQEEWAAAKSTI